MKDKMQSIHDNHTWNLVSLPSKACAISSKWIYKIKPATTTIPHRFKACLVAQGFYQREGIDYDDIFAHIAKYNTIQSFSAIAASHTWDMFHLDFHIAFLNSKLQHFIYIKQNVGLTEPGNEALVYLFKKALYGLKQSPRDCFHKIDKLLKKLFLKQSFSEGNLYYQCSTTLIIIIVLYIDNLFFTGVMSQRFIKLKLSSCISFKCLT